MKRQLLLLSVFLGSLIGMHLYLSRPPKERYVDTVAKVLPTTVTIYVSVSRIRPGTENEVQRAQIQGSGVFITRNGHILSCAHLFNHGFKIESVTVETYEGWVLPATILYVDSQRDLSLIRVEDTYSPCARVVRPGNLHVGQEVIAIGAPEGLSGSVSTGVISALDRDDLGYDQIQMSAPINPGNSGGPLFNLNGEVVGVNVMVLTTTPLPIWSGLGFAVSDNEINIFLHEFKGLSEVTKN